MTTNTRKKQVNVRLATLSQQQLDELTEVTGMTQTQIIAMAIDKLHTELVKK